MASGPIISWEVDGQTVAEFIFLGSKITADGDCSHEIKGSLLLGSRVMTNLDSILKSRDSLEEGGVIWENGIETCIIPYMKRIASPGSMHLQPTVTTTSTSKQSLQAENHHLENDLFSSS